MQWLPIGPQKTTQNDVNTSNVVSWSQLLTMPPDQWSTVTLVSNNPGTPYAGSTFDERENPDGTLLADGWTPMSGHTDPLTGDWITDVLDVVPTLIATQPPEPEKRPQS